MSFFLEYSLPLVITLLTFGFLLGMILGYLCWGTYWRKSNDAQLKLESMKTDLKNLQSGNRDLKAEIATRS